MPNKTVLKSLLYRSHAYQQLFVEGCADHNPEAFDKWSNFAIATTFTPTHIRITIPSRGEGLPVSLYEEHEILTGLWTICSDFGTDTETYYLCRNWLTAWLRRLLCMLTAEGPYIVHTITLGGD